MHDTGIDQIIPGAILDSKIFEPCGFSVNAIIKVSPNKEGQCLDNSNGSSKTVSFHNKSFYMKVREVVSTWLYLHSNNIML